MRLAITRTFEASCEGSRWSSFVWLLVVLRERPGLRSYRVTERL